MDAEGIEIGSHSNTHPHMPKLNDTQLDLELSASASAVTDITGKAVELFRAPFGDYSDRTMNACKRAGLIPVQWDVDSCDWKELSAKAVAERVLSRVKNGSIILFHNDGKHTAEALPAILAGLKNKGYQAVSAGGLLIKGDYYIDHAGTMRQK
jgi:peptidoglycan/xylan/chitin deacetylase (PgdA/CDA1 family)